MFIHNVKTAGTSIEMSLKSKISDESAHINFGLHKHSNLYEIPQEIISGGYYKFCFVRDPWDRCLSLYRYMLWDKNHKNHEEVKSINGFGNFIEDRYLKWRDLPEAEKDRGVWPQHLYSHINGVRVVDKIGKYETLKEDYSEVCRKIFGNTVNLPTVNVNRDKRTKIKNYLDAYSDKHYRMVHEFSRLDVDYFGYSH